MNNSLNLVAVYQLMETRRAMPHFWAARQAKVDREMEMER